MWFSSRRPLDPISRSAGWRSAACNAVFEACIGVSTGDDTDHFSFVSPRRASAYSRCGSTSASCSAAPPHRLSGSSPPASDLPSSLSAVSDIILRGRLPSQSPPSHLKALLCSAPCCSRSSALGRASADTPTGSTSAGLEHRPCHTTAGARHLLSSTASAPTDADDAAANALLDQGLISAEAASEPRGQHVWE